MLGIYDSDEMAAMCRHIFRCNLGIDRDFRMHARIHTKWSVMPAILTVKYSVDEEGLFQSATFCMVPLPGQLPFEANPSTPVTPLIPQPTSSSSKKKSRISSSSPAVQASLSAQPIY
jgi:hypothetical protein